MSDPLYINAVDVGGGVLEPAYDAAELRRGSAVGLFPGVADETGARQGVRPGHVAASVAGTTWTVHDLVAVVYPGLNATAGPYRVQHLEESGALDPADGSNGRIDALDLQVRDDDEDASGERDARVVYVTGTPAASPSAPAQTANSLRLAEILVPSGGSPSPTLTQVAPWTVAAGGILPVRDSSELPSSGTYEGMAAYDQGANALVVDDGSDFVPLASPNSPTQVVFESSGTFTPANFPWARKFRVRCVGGGGEGGGSPATSGSTVAAGAGGGGGGYAESVLDAQSVTTPITVTVGSGGSGGGTGTGAAGGTTSFGSLVIASGGSGGDSTGATSASNTARGGVGGVGSAGAVQGGGGAGVYSSTLAAPRATGGTGGSSVLGGGGRGGVAVASQDAGLAGRGYGGGGGGVANGTSNGSITGGDGADGVCIVDVY